MTSIQDWLLSAIDEGFILILIAGTFALVAIIGLLIAVSVYFITKPGDTYGLQVGIILTAFTAGMAALVMSTYLQGPIQDDYNTKQLETVETTTDMVRTGNSQSMNQFTLASTDSAITFQNADDYTIQPGNTIGYKTIHGYTEDFHNGREFVHFIVYVKDKATL